MFNGVVNGLDEAVQPFDSSLQRLFVRPEGGQHIEIGAAHNGFDLVETQVQFAVEQDLL